MDGIDHTWGERTEGFQAGWSWAHGSASRAQVLAYVKALDEAVATGRAAAVPRSASAFDDDAEDPGLYRADFDHGVLSFWSAVVDALEIAADADRRIKVPSSLSPDLEEAHAVVDPDQLLEVLRTLVRWWAPKRRTTGASGFP